MSKNKTTFKWVKMLAILAVILGLNTMMTQAAEHPEHPSQPEKQMEPKVSIETMSQAISNYITNDAKLKGGYFMFYDKKDNKPLLLTLDKVHKDRLAQVGDNLFFACTDFKEKSGKMYDLDFFMKADQMGKLKVSEVMIHKEDGQPRYTWYEDNGIWKRKQVK